MLGCSHGDALIVKHWPANVISASPAHSGGESVACANDVLTEISMHYENMQKIIQGLKIQLYL